MAKITAMISVCAPIVLFVLATFHMEHLQHPCQMKDHRKVGSGNSDGDNVEQLLLSIGQKKQGSHTDVVEHRTLITKWHIQRK